MGRNEHELLMFSLLLLFEERSKAVKATADGACAARLARLPDRRSRSGCRSVHRTAVGHHRTALHLPHEARVMCHGEARAESEKEHRNDDSAGLMCPLGCQCSAVSETIYENIG